MSNYENPETTARYENGFKKFAKNGLLDVLQIVDALEAAKEYYNEYDVVDALEVMGIKGEQISFDQFRDVIGIMKHPEHIIDAFEFLMLIKEELLMKMNSEAC